jgi:hypothetical protein
VAVTERLRDCAPLPHDLVHVDQAPKAEVAQWIGHGPWSHACVSAVCGHTTPPYFGATLVRLRDWKPLAHDVVQVDQTLKVPTPQFTGHIWVPHVRTSVP